MKQPWDIRDPSPRGDAQENDIFVAVGSALTEWENVEVECAKLFAVLVSTSLKRTYLAPAVRAYGAIISVRSKGEMLRLAAESYFERRRAKQASFRDTFNERLKEYREFSNRRNDIAHGCLKSVFVTEQTTKKGRRRGAIGFYLLPSFYNPKKFKEEKFSYQYTSSDIIYYRQEFTKLQLRIESLRERMIAKQRRAA